MCNAPKSEPRSHLPCQCHAYMLSSEKWQLAYREFIASDYWENSNSNSNLDCIRSVSGQLSPTPIKDQSSISPKDTRFTTRTLCSSGTNLKFTNCTPGQTIQFFAKAVPYALFNLSVGLEPSMIAILLKKTNMCVVANTHWSVRTRATIVRFSLRKVIFCWRNLYQIVAAGPKTAMKGRWIVSDSYSLPWTSVWVLRVLGRELDATDLLRTRPFVLFLRSCAYPALLFRLFVVPWHLRLQIVSVGVQEGLHLGRGMHARAG